ncbi:hypothetical protein [Sphingomonas jaspsi]|uniref:hypothetical protein n=1 Tax=Sphingomonas jaspsi TaxID=392409 RepID=UPI0004B9A9B8|nr:hypothetical protein [Sphingomonas jaspsi]
MNDNQEQVSRSIYALAVLFASAIIVAAAYLVTAFVSWDMNPAAWTTGCRMFFVLLTLFALVMAFKDADDDGVE